MKILVKAGRQRVVCKDISAPVPEKDEAVIAVKACGICGSEMHVYDSESGGEPTGHELAGIIEQAPKGSLLKTGDRVVLNVVCGCGECGECGQGRENFCCDWSTKGRPFRPGGHAEKVVYVARNCLKIPDTMSFEAAVATGGCGIGVAWHGIKRLGIMPAEKVCVFGVGPIGLAAVMLIKQMGAQAIALDVSEYRLNLAGQFGAVRSLNSRDLDAMRTLPALGIRHSILCTGNHEAAKSALALLAPRGQLLILGGLSAWPLDSWQMIGIGDKTIFGSWHYHREEWPDILKLVSAGLPAQRLVTHVFNFTRADEAYALFRQGNAGKVILKPD